MIEANGGRTEMGSRAGHGVRLTEPPSPVQLVEQVVRREGVPAATSMVSV